jgi:methylase of polypeptide subunit release factors
VYTLPPNQALSAQSQEKINRARGQTPPRRDVKAIIAKKTRLLLSSVDAGDRSRLGACSRTARWITGSAADEFWEPHTVDLVVTSPPFLDVVDYAGDNWLRGWFCGIEADGVEIALHRKVGDWQAFVGRVFRQLARLLRPGGYVAFEVGEVKHGAVRLEEAVLPCGLAAGFEPTCILINQQAFTKTANIWGVANNRRGTNTNRIVVFRQPEG